MVKEKVYLGVKDSKVSQRRGKFAPGRTRCSTYSKALQNKIFCSIRKGKSKTYWKSFQDSARKKQRPNFCKIERKLVFCAKASWIYGVKNKEKQELG